jgi:hypothetical protein
MAGRPITPLRGFVNGESAGRMVNENPVTLLREKLSLGHGLIPVNYAPLLGALSCAGNRERPGVWFIPPWRRPIRLSSRLWRRTPS